MKNLILGLLGVIAAVLLVLVVVIAMQPSQFKITRSATFNAPPEALFAQVNDFNNWPAWSPWEKLDPNMKKEVSNPSAGKGATYHWVGNEEVGEGKMTIAESHPSEHIKVDLDFIKPFAMKSVTDYTFKTEGGKTTMTWSMTGENGFLGKAFGLMMNMDKLVGADFEKGLANLKPVVEGK